MSLRPHKDERDRVHVIYGLGASPFPTVANGSDIFFIVCTEKIYRTEDILVPVRGRERGTAFIIRPHPRLIFDAL